MNKMQNLAIKVAIDSSHNAPQIANVIIKSIADLKRDILVLDNTTNAITTSHNRMIDITDVNNQMANGRLDINPKIEASAINQGLEVFNEIYEQFELIGTAWVRYCNLTNNKQLENNIDGYGAEVFNLFSQLPSSKDVRQEIFQLYQYQVANRLDEAQRYVRSNISNTVTIIITIMRKLRDILKSFSNDDVFAPKNIIDLMDRESTPINKNRPFLNRNPNSPSNIYGVPRQSFQRSYTKGVI